MEYKVTLNRCRPNCEKLWFGSFREAYDAAADYRAEVGMNSVSISFDKKEWVFKTKEDIWPTEDCVENLSNEYKNEQNVDAGYWVCFLSEAPNLEEVTNMENNGDITPEEREKMLERARIVEVLNEDSFFYS